MSKEDDVLAFRSRPLPRFGDVVLHPYQGRGMVYGVTGDGSLLIAFEDGCVCTGYQGLRYIGSIFELEAPAKPIRKEEQKALPDEN
jgi:hypothetical protein